MGVGRVRGRGYPIHLQEQGIQMSILIPHRATCTTYPFEKHRAQVDESTHTHSRKPDPSPPYFTRGLWTVCPSTQPRSKSRSCDTAAGYTRAYAAHGLADRLPKWISESAIPPDMG